MSVQGILVTNNSLYFKIMDILDPNYKKRERKDINQYQKFGFVSE